MERIKMSADTEPEIVSLVDKASEIEGRTRAGFMRFHLRKTAEEVLQQNKLEKTS